MRKLILALAAVLSLGLGFAAPAAAQGGRTPSATPESLTDVCRSAVKDVRALTADLEVPDHLLQDNATKNGTEFDANQYFSVLHHLSLPGGHVLDYVYDYQWIGGRPVLYVRPVDQTPYATYTDLGNALGDVPYYLASVQTDDTAAGYLQLAALDVMGGQFYLEWHANYNDYQVICDQAAVEQILSSDNGFGQNIPDEARQAARKLDVTPSVEFVDHEVRVKLVVFTKWGGFLRLTFTMSRDFPRSTYETDSETLVEYDCGIMF